MTKKKESSIGFVSLSTYTSPKIVESKNDDYVSFGENNDYFQYLIDRYNGSPTNNAIINGISQMIFGRGLDATDSSRKPNEYAQMKSLLKDDDLRKLAHELKLTGQGALQIQFDRSGKRVLYVEHIPIETLRAKKLGENDNEVKAYYYHADWSKYKRNDVLKEIPAFGSLGEGKHAQLEILYIKPYKAGMYYYATPDYQGGLQYAELEEEISNFHLNNILNGMSPNMLINFNNGVPDKEAQREIERKIKEKYSGSSNAGNFILAFNDNKESQATIEPVQLSDAHNQYQFLSDESMRKIMVAHRVVSPMLLGVKDNTGLGNNADELKQASILMDNIVIKPFQDLIIENLEKVLAVNGISLNLYFKTLQPLEFTDLDNVKDEETREEETGVKMSKIFMSLEELGEEEDLDNWELIDERKVDYDKEDELDAEIEELNRPKLSALKKAWNFVSTGRAIPNAKSSQDGEDREGLKYKVRYQYAPLRTSSDSREFCQRMVAAKKIYRKEDIQRMSQMAVNAGWGLNGADTYDIWLYKGGGACHHFWMRKTYRSKDKRFQPDVGNPNAEVSVNQARKDGFKPEVNEKEVAMRPVDMPNKGFVNK